MGSAREEFLAQLVTVSQAADLESLRDPTPPDPDRAEIARVLRNGLAVAAFAAVEDFIRRRNHELLSYASTGSITFAEITEELQRAVTQRALASLVAHARRQVDDPTQLIQTEAGAIGATATGSLTFPSLTLSWEGSNISESDVAVMLKTLGVRDGWQSMTYLTRRAGFGSSGLDADFRSLVSARNLAAHNATTDTSLLALRSFHRSAMAIACGYDLLASRAARLIQEVTTPPAGGQPVRPSDVRIRFIETRGGNQWAEVREQKRKPAVRRYSSRTEARAQALTRATANHEALVELDRTGVPTWWISGDHPL